MVSVRDSFHQLVTEELLLYWHKLVMHAHVASYNKNSTTDLLGRNFEVGQWRTDDMGDGNGRIGRALSEIILAQDMQSPVLLSLSAEIEFNKKIIMMNLVSQVMI